MGHGVNVIVECGVSREEAMVLVLGKPFAKKTTHPTPAKRPEEQSLSDRAEAIAIARKHINAAKQVIGKIAP
jgi:hypothetical protein